MTNTEILEKAIKIAMADGYIPKTGVAYFQVEDDNGECFSEHGSYLIDYETCKMLVNVGLYKNLQLLTVHSNYFQLIFSHEFAKAFWGETEVCRFCGKNINDIESSWGFCGSDKCQERDIGEYRDYLKNWEYHLQQMVLEKEPLKYLERFLDED